MSDDLVNELAFLQLSVAFVEQRDSEEVLEALMITFSSLLANRLGVTVKLKAGERKLKVKPNWEPETLN